MIDTLVDYNRVRPIAPVSLLGQKFSVFGTGGFASSILRAHPGQVTQIIDYQGGGEFQGFKIIPVEQARGKIILGTGSGGFQLNQIKALMSRGADVEEILIYDPFYEQRLLIDFNPSKTIVLIEHADGIIRHQPHLVGFKKFFQQQGYNIVSVCPLMLGHFSQYLQATHFFVWGGQREIYQTFYQQVEQSRYSFLEYGFFPQSDYYYVDRVGVNHQCELMNDPLDWVEEKHFLQLEQIKDKFLAGFKHNSAASVIVPLQVPDDANVVQSSRFTHGMQEFIDYIDSFYPQKENIVFKCHPKDPFKHTYNFRGRLNSDLPFLTLLKDAKSVHGISSSTLYEAALAGIDVIIESNCLLRKHEFQKHKLLAAMVTRQIPVGETNILPWLDRYSQFKANL